MARLTITLSDEMHRALKEASARRRKSIRRIIEESLELYGIKTTATAAQLVDSVRERGLDDDEAQRLAIDETRRARGR